MTNEILYDFEDSAHERREAGGFFFPIAGISAIAALILFLGPPLLEDGGARSRQVLRKIF